MTITFPSFRTRTLSKDPHMRRNSLDQLENIPHMDLPDGIHALARAAAINTLASSQLEEDTIKLTLDQMTDHLTSRIEKDAKKKNPSQELGLIAVHEAMTLSLTNPSNEALQRLAETAIHFFPGVAQPTLQAAFSIGRNEGLTLNEALDKANDQRSKAA